MMIKHVYTLQTATLKVLDERLAAIIDEWQSAGLTVEVQTMCPPPSNARYAALLIARA